jgi:hypothetical protein
MDKTGKLQEETAILTLASLSIVSSLLFAAISA